jgi:hypothetical protein
MTTQRVALQNLLDRMLTHVPEYRRGDRDTLTIDRGTELVFSGRANIFREPWCIM